MVQAFFYWGIFDGVGGAQILISEGWFLEREKNYRRKKVISKKLFKIC